MTKGNLTCSGTIFDMSMRSKAKRAATLLISTFLAALSISLLLGGAILSDKHVDICVGVGSECQRQSEPQALSPVWGMFFYGLALLTAILAVLLAKRSTRLK
jgi:hypothetical protein